MMEAKFSVFLADLVAKKKIVTLVVTLKDKDFVINSR